MRRVVKIGDIELDHGLFVKEEFDLKNVLGKSFDTISGGKVVYESIKRNNANYYTLIPYENGWLKENTIKQIMILADDIDVSTQITFDNGDVIKVRFAYEKGQVLKAEPLYENSEWFKVTISLCRI